MRWRGIGAWVFFGVALGCVLASLGAATGSAFAREGSLCESESVTTCGARDLPRVTQGSWDDATIRRFVERAANGTVAVALVGDGTAAQARLVESCRLPGGYTEVVTKPGSGRLWATNRVILLPSEVDASCTEATHEIVAFARGADPGGRPSSPKTRRTFSAILVPLPCPSVTDTVPARHCLGLGADGAARLETALKMARTIRNEKVRTASLSYALKIFALAPDEPQTFEYASHVNTECALTAHARWAEMQYHITLDANRNMIAVRKPADDPELAIDRPVLDAEGSTRNCLHQPVFRKCFPGIADPVPGPTGCWAAAPVAKKP